MNKRDELLTEIEWLLQRAENTRSQIRKRVNAGRSNESHLAYAEGLVGGLEDAKSVIIEAFKEVDCRENLSNPDDEGRGPWRPGFSDKWVEDRTDAEFERLKPIQQDFPRLNLLLCVQRGEYVGVGCESLVKLRQWFTASEYATLLGYGYQCVRLDVDYIVASSDIQCVFLRLKPLNKGIKVVRLYHANRQIADATR